MRNSNLNAESTVESLVNFPFSSFHEFVYEYSKRSFDMRIDRTFALIWVASGGKHVSKFYNIRVFILSQLYKLIIVGYGVYTLFELNWWYLLAIPLLSISFYLLNPSPIYKFIRRIIVLLSIISLVLSFQHGYDGVLLFCISILIIWFSQKRAFKISSNYFFRKVITHEDLLCATWESAKLGIIFRNGIEYYVDSKFPIYSN